MSNFKPNPTMLAYARKSLAKSKINYQNHSATPTSKSQDRNSIGNLYEAIMCEMGPQHHRYINRLIHQNQKNQNIHQNVGHQRAKSYADILVQNNHHRNTDNIPSQQPKHISQDQTFYQTNEDIKVNKTSYNQQGFLEEINCYIDNLNNIKRNNIIYQSPKIKEMAKNQNIFLIKLQQQSNKIKELKRTNHILENQQIKSHKKHKIMKQKLYEMLNHIKFLNSQLNREREEKKYMQLFFVDFEEKMKRFKPQRKTTGYKQNHKYLQFAQYQVNSNDSSKNSSNNFDSILSNTYKYKNKKQNSLNPGLYKQNHKIMTEDEIQQLFGCKENEDFSDNESISHH